MKWHVGLALFATLILGAGACGEGPAASQPFKKVRPAAVAGLFYPQDRDELARKIDGFLEQAKKSPMAHLRGLVCPHAGYEFSGPVAAYGYKQVQGRPLATVIVMGPSHYAYFQGAALPDADAMATPLGLIPVSPKAARLAASPPLAVNPCARFSGRVGGGGRRRRPRPAARIRRTPGSTPSRPSFPSSSGR